MGQPVPKSRDYPENFYRERIAQYGIDHPAAVGWDPAVSREEAIAMVATHLDHMLPLAPAERDDISVLEFGCGNLIVHDALTRVCRMKRYEGVELNQSFIDYGLARGVNVSPLLYTRPYTIVVVADAFTDMSMHERLDLMRQLITRTTVCLITWFPMSGDYYCDGWSPDLDMLTNICSPYKTRIEVTSTYNEGEDKREATLGMDKRISTARPDRALPLRGRGKDRAKR